MKGKFCTFLLAMLLCISFMTTSCKSYKKHKAIEICQNTRILSDKEFCDGNIFALMSLRMAGLEKDATWLDYANLIASIEPNKKFQWDAHESEGEDNIYIVGFFDEEDWGQYWQVDIKGKIVRFINTQEYLSREYGHTRLDHNAPFSITDISIDDLKVSNTGVSYSIKGTITNHTGIAISYAELDGELCLIFENKTEKAGNGWWSEHRILSREISESTPWYNNEPIEFSINTEEIKRIYLNYEPKYSYFRIGIKAGDPIGYSYDKDIYEIDLKERWNILRDENNFSEK